MRLLTKSEVQQELAVERKMQIDEGISLARKVDGLRQKASSEEASLENFRKGTSTQILSEVSELIKERDVLKSELLVLKDTCATALVPIAAKQKEVAAQLEELTSKEAEVEEREERLAVAEREHAARYATLYDKESRIADTQEAIGKLLRDAMDTATHAESMSDAALENAKKQELLHEQVNKNLQQREESVAIRERHVETRTQSVEVREAKAVAKERQLTDLYETYKRNLERDGKRITRRK